MFVCLLKSNVKLSNFDAFYLDIHFLKSLIGDCRIFIGKGNEILTSSKLRDLNHRLP